MRYIDSFREGMHISDVYLCKNRQIALTKNGKEYGNLVLQDKTGTIDAKIWDLGSPGVGNFETLDYVYIDADVTVFMGANQLNVKRIRKADEGEYIPADYLPVSLKDVKQMYSELLALIASVKNPYLRSGFCQGISVPQRGKERTSRLCGRPAGAYLKRCQNVRLLCRCISDVKP